MMLCSTMIKLHCTKQLSRYQSVSFYGSVAKVCDILKSQLGLSDTAIDDLPKHRLAGLSNITEFHLQHNCIACQELNLDNVDLLLLPSILTRKPALVVHRVKLLQEMGNCRPTLQNVKCVYHDMHQTVREFKKLQNIDPNLNIAQHVFDTLGRPLKNSSHLIELSDEMPCSAYYEHLLIYFNTWVLGLSRTKPVANVNVKVPSFQVLIEMMDVLVHELGIDPDYVKKHPAMLHYSPVITRALWEKFKNMKLENVTFKELVMKYWHVLDNDPETLTELLKVLKEYGVPDSAILNCKYILRVSPDDFRARFQMYMSIPELSLWRNHPRLLYLIYHHKIVLHHLEHLRLANRLNDINIHTVSASKGYFSRFLNRETSSPSTLKHIRILLEAELGKERPDVTQKITRHPFWRNVTYLRISTSLNYLKTKYSPKDIWHGIHLILYPLDVVSTTLEKVEREYSRENGYNLSPGQMLALCVYMIEKGNHFTGDGIWQLDSAEHTFESTSGTEQTLAIPAIETPPPLNKYESES